MDFGAPLRRLRTQLWFQQQFLKYKYVKGELELRVVGRMLPPGKTAIDVGCSFGFYSKELARYAPRVIAFEANPAVAAIARTVAPRNVRVIDVALSSHAGTTQLRVPINARGRPSTELATIHVATHLPTKDVATIDVDTRRLDDYDFADCGFIKVDVEGHEADVLDGAMGLIGAQRPLLMLELEETFCPGAVASTSARFASLSYAGYFLWHGRLRPVAEFNRVLHQNLETVRGIPLRRARTMYVNNFFFVPAEMASRLTGPA